MTATALILAGREEQAIRNLLIYAVLMVAVILLAAWLSYDEPAPLQAEPQPTSAPEATTI